MREIPPGFRVVHEEEVADLARLRCENEALRRVAEAYLSEWRLPGPECTCDVAWSGRGLEDPDCMYHKSPAVWDALRAAFTAWEKVRDEA